MDEKDGIEQDESLGKDESTPNPDGDAVASDNSGDPPASDAESSSEPSDTPAEKEMTPEEKEMMRMAQEDDDPSDSAAGDIDPPADDVDASSDIGDSGGGTVGPLSQEEIDNALKGAADMPAFEEPVEDDPGDGGGEPAVKQADFQQLSSGSETTSPKNIELLMDVDLPVAIELGSTKMKISDILNLAPGSIVELEKLVGEPVDLLVNQKCVARGEVVVVEESFGLRITQLVSPEERLRNLQ